MVLVTRPCVKIGAMDSKSATKTGFGDASPCSVIDTCWEEWSSKDDYSSDCESSTSCESEPSRYFDFDFTEVEYFPGTDCPTVGWFQPCEGCSRMTARVLDMADGAEHPVCARCAASCSMPPSARTCPSSIQSSMRPPSIFVSIMEREHVSSWEQPGKQETESTTIPAAAVSGCHWLLSGQMTGMIRRTRPTIPLEKRGETPGFWDGFLDMLGSLFVMANEPPSPVASARVVGSCETTTPIVPKQPQVVGSATKRKPQLRIHV
mmetsp:Transcript_3026/g.5479  ORF Transcript_3026/g.5479 Transcript_3026/m.5479 type:complete len:263 (-) Transcript_3026:23-811(-)